MKYLLLVFTILTLVSCKKDKVVKPQEEIKNKVEVVSDTATKASPKFTNYENYDGSKTSLSDLKGKYVYVDVWATWCPPCRAEIPHLQKLEKKYHNRNIAFVSISLDKESDKVKWKKMIKDKKMSGIQLFAGKDQTFTKGYGIRGIPRFILIDPQGNIANANAPRPSNVVAIDKLFAKI